MEAFNYADLLNTESQGSGDDLKSIRYRTAKHVPVDFDQMGYGTRECEDPPLTT